MKLQQHRRALELIHRHPGWSDRRIARKLGVAPSTIGRWRWQAGYPPYTKNVTWTGRPSVPPGKSNG